jgi:hypothetical protein
MEKLRYLLGYDCCFSVNCTGRSGGLAFMWRNSFHCSITNFSSNHIDVEVEDNINGNWRLTGFYGFPGSSRRRDSWNFLRQLARTSDLPWCVIGDFNDILSPTEKKGRAERAPSLINGFRSAVLDSGLNDVHMQGYPFTWFKSLGTNRAVEEKLDRALATKTWFNIFPNAILENLPAPASDHYPIMLLKEPATSIRSDHSRFKFESAWLFDVDFHDFVCNKWQSYGENDILSKLSLCAEDLFIWNRDNIQNLKKDIDKCRRKIEHIRNQVHAGNIYHFNSLRKRMSHLLVKEDAFWRQRAKTHWFREGDLNTRFFHAATTSRCKINRISSLVNSSGTQKIQTCAMLPETNLLKFSRGRIVLYLRF